MQKNFNIFYKYQLKKSKSFKFVIKNKKQSGKLVYLYYI